MTLPARNLPWPISWDGVVEIARSEGCRLAAYRCSAGRPTIGWGETRGVRMGDVITQEQADRKFCDSLTEFADGVRKLLTRDPSGNEFAAMVSLAYNIGLGGFERSTVRRMHNAGDHQAAGRAFALWNKAGGAVIPGLTARRAREAALYLTPDADTLPMPQQVDPESSITKSPIAQSGVASIVAAVTAMVSSVTEPIKQFSAATGLQPVHVVAAVALVVGVVVIAQRLKQRRGGWS